MPRILFAEQFYYPEGWGGAQLPRDITIHLARSGWQVEVICGSDTYAPVDDENIEDPTSAGVTIRRIPRLFDGDIHRRKLLRQLWFYIAAIPRLLVGKPSLYVTQTNPPLIVPITALVAVIRRRPLVIIAQDLYPEILFAHGMVGGRGFVARILAWIFRWAYRRATKVVSLGPTMSRRLVEKGVRRERIAEICNWATGAETIVRGSENKLRAEWGLTGKFVVLYSGNLGIAHDVETPLRAIARLRQEVPNVTLVFIGKGSRLAEAQQLTASLGIQDAVQFRSFVPMSLLPHSLGLADLALVTLQRGFEGLVVPSKLLGYLARGVATVYVGPPSDISFYIQDSGAGVSFGNGEEEAMAQALAGLSKAPAQVDAMGQRGERYYSEKLSRATALNRYSTLIADIASSASRSG
jgi:glycosyltransferase involved in cell wall biosynthesis